MTVLGFLCTTKKVGKLFLPASAELEAELRERVAVVGPTAPPVVPYKLVEVLEMLERRFPGAKVESLKLLTPALAAGQETA